MFNSPMRIETNGRAKLLVNGDEMKVEDITAVRYDLMNSYICFNEGTNQTYYNDEMFSIVAHNRSELPRSLHIVQIDVCSTEMDKVVAYIREKCGKVAVFCYVTYGSPSWVEQIGACKEAYEAGLIDRLMIREPREANLDAITIKNIFNVVCNTLGIKKADKVGFCDSPVGCSIGYSCLPAALCRHLSAQYGDDIDMILPSQNHEGMSEDTTRACNCIGHVLVRNIEPCPVKVGKSSTSNTKEKQPKSEGEQKKNKAKTSGKKIIEKW